MEFSERFLDSRFSWLADELSGVLIMQKVPGRALFARSLPNRFKWAGHLDCVLVGGSRECAG